MKEFDYESNLPTETSFKNTITNKSRFEKYKKILDSLEGRIPNNNKSYEEMLQEALEEKFLINITNEKHLFYLLY